MMMIQELSQETDKELYFLEKLLRTVISFA